MRAHLNLRCRPIHPSIFSLTPVFPCSLSGVPPGSFNKQVLKAFPHPLTCTWLQFGVGSLLALSMWAVKAHPRPNLNEDTLKSILPLAGVHTLGNLLTNVSLGAVAVSFTHTIKAMEPFFSVLLSSIFLNEKPTAAVLLSMLPIVGGVALASATEMSFNWAGFTAAMGSNLTFQSRNVLSKKFMGKGKGSLDNINLFSTITILAFCLMTPVVLLTDGFLLTPAALKASGVGEAIIRQALAAAVCFHAYQQVSYMILARVSPVSHSIGNCLKRVIVIVASVLFFRNPMGTQNMVGTAIALAGVFAYSQVKRGQNAAAAKVA